MADKSRLVKMAISAPSYKVIIIGNSGVGKTTLFHRILFDTFVDTRSNKETTIFLDCYEKTISISGKEIKVKAQLALFGLLPSCNVYSLVFG